MFKSAKIKLTISYILVLTVITGSFSTLVYLNFRETTKRALERHEERLEKRINDFGKPKPPIEFEKPLTEETFQEINTKIITILILINGIIITLTGAISYWLAGVTLKPIEIMTQKQKKFIEDAAHELRTPLTGMKTNIEVNLRDKNINLEKTKEILNETIKDIDELSILANSLLEQSKNQQIIQNNIDKVYMNEVIKNLKSKFNKVANEKSISLEFTNNIEDIIIIDKQKLQQLLSIFIDNAIKFNKPGGVVKTLASHKNNRLEVTIEDTGIGIKKEDIPHIYERFYKSEKSRNKKNNKGFGLGLSIAKEIITQLNGQISVTSKVGESTKFTIYLPINSQ